MNTNTQAQPAKAGLLHSHLIRERTPEWLANAPASTHAALRRANKNPMDWLERGRLQWPEIVSRLQQVYAKHREHEQRVAPILERLGTPQSFAGPMLRAEIWKQFGLEVDVHKTYLLHASRAQTDNSFGGASKDPFVQANVALHEATQTLLNAALQNFQASETQAGVMDRDQALKAQVFSSYQILGAQIGGTPLAMPAHEFAAMSRRLDLGARYQAHIHYLFNSSDPAEDPADSFKGLESTAFEMHLHITLLKGFIDPADHAALLAVARGQPPSRPVVCNALSLWDAQLRGVVVFEIGDKVALYIPEDPLVPLQVFSSFETLHDGLRKRLFKPGYLPFFSRFIPARESRRVVAKLHERLYPMVNKNKWYEVRWMEQQADPNASLYLSRTRFEGALPEALYAQKLAGIKDDALFHAVPSALQDRKSSKERLAYWRDKAMDVLNIAAFAVPALGVVMLAVTAAQLSYEVYEGIESWTHDEREQALGYLFDVVENLAFMAALGAVSEPGSRLPAIEVPAVVDTLEAVQLPDGQTRLWKPDLSPFAHDILLPADLKPNGLGLYEHQGKQWLALDGNTYSVKPASNGNGLVMEHPNGRPGFEPPLRHNGAGAWLHPLDKPLQMYDLTLLRRLGYDAVEFPDAMARQILITSNTPESVLRHTLADMQRPPALLEDTAQRFKLDRELGLKDRRADFESVYQSQQTSFLTGVEQLQKTLPSRLPKAVAEELLEHATPAELQDLVEHNRLALRLAEEARVYQQQVRLSRAFEGLYLESVQTNPDTQKLILHSLETLPGWSSEVCLEVRDRHFSGALLDSIGAPDAPIRKVLVTSADGYEAHDAEGLHLNGRADLYASVLHALPDAERRALGFPNTGQRADLQRAIQNQPMPRRQLRQALGMTPVKPAFRSPMRLADGRIGYPLSGRIRPDWAITLDSLLDKLRILAFEDVYPDEILDRLRASGMDNRSIDERLNTLLDEQQQLRASLSAWADETVAMPTGSATQATNRTFIADTIWSHWSQNNLPEIGRHQQPLRLLAIALEDFPSRLPDFFYQRVISLELHGVTTYAGVGEVNLIRALDHDVLGRFLRRFTHTRSLTMGQPELGGTALWGHSDLPQTIASALPGLTDLALINQQLWLDQQQMNAFRGFESLRTLDLSGNRLHSGLPIMMDWLRLDRLVMERMLLQQWPVWLDLLLPGNIRELSLADNRLSLLPARILDNPPGNGRESVINLRGNPLTLGTLQTIGLEGQLPGRSWRIEADMPPLLASGLEIQRAERDELAQALEAWSETSSSQAPLSQQRIASRWRIGQALMDHWRAYARGETQRSLFLVSVDLADFPEHLPALVYTRTRSVHLSQVSATAEQLDHFFRRFPNLKNVELNGPMTPVLTPPQGLLDLRALTSLSLIDQGILIDQDWVKFFARLSLLDELNLDGNRLGDIQDISGLRAINLRWLSLRNTGLSQWPQWLLELLPQPLESLLLNNNQLTDIPQVLLDNPRRQWGHTEISLTGNPLSHESMTQAHTSQHYGRSYSFEMDMPDDIRDITWHQLHDSDSSTYDSEEDGYDSEGYHDHSPATSSEPEPPSVDPWLDTAVGQAVARRSAWQQLESEGDAQNLLELVSYLQRSADYRNPDSRPQLVERVWHLLDAAVQDPQLRSTFEAIAEEPLRLMRNEETCPDGVMIEFNQMEVLVFTRQSLLEVPSGTRGSALYNLTLRLYRLHELDRIAREQAGTRDEAEVRLAYRLHWARELNLPVPPQRMLYEAHAGLLPGELDNALARVQAGERGEAFLEYAAGQTPWTTYLREHYASRFDVLEQAYRSQLTGLTDRFDQRGMSLTSPEFEAAARDLQQQWQNDQLALINVLTTEEIISQPVITAPDAPEPPARS